MKKTVLFVVLEPYADWEAAYLSSLLAALGQERYEVKTVALTKQPLKSMGGLTVLPDYDIASVPAEYEACILVGGMSWRKEAAQQIKPLVMRTLERKKVLGGICDASGFLGTLGVLNNVKHTSNDLNDLKNWAGDAYTGEKNYLMQPAVSDQNIITANGTAPIEFAKEVLITLGVAPEKKILEWYNFHKKGLYEAPMPSI